MVAINAMAVDAGRYGQASSAPVAVAKPRAKHQLNSSASNQALSFTLYRGEILIIQVLGTGTIKVAVEDDPTASAPDATAAYDWQVGSNLNTYQIELMARADGTRVAITDV